MDKEPVKFGWYQVLILILSVYVLIVLAVEIILEL